MTGTNQPPRRILIASANPLFSKGLQRLFAEQWAQSAPQMRLASSMADTLDALHTWAPDLVVVDYDDRTINRAEFLNHYVSSDVPMQVMLVSLQESGEVVVYDRRTMDPAEVQSWLHASAPRAVPAAPAMAQAESPVETPAAAPSRRLQPRWVLLSVLVLVAVAAFIRLGFWQLDRLEQRREHNARVRAEINQPALDLNASLPNDTALAAMEFRTANATGIFDRQGEVVLRNQAWGNRLGVHLLTPLRLANGRYILVDRGWIPYEESDTAARQKYAQTGAVSVSGMLRASQPSRGLPQSSPDAFAEINLDTIRQATSLDLLPVYLVQAPGPDANALPYRSLPEVELDEGPHLGYALQWFFFALLLLVGYPIFLRRQMREQRAANSASNNNGTTNHQVSG